MDATEIEACMTKAQKSHMRNALSDYVQKEMRYLMEDKAHAYAKVWLKSNEGWIEEEMSKEMLAQVKKRIKRASLHIEI